MTPPHLWIAAGIVQHLVRFAERSGYDVANALAASALTPADLSAPRGKIPLTRHLELFRQLAQQSEEPGFALHSGASAALGSLRVVGPLLGSASTLADGLGYLARFSPLTSNAGTLELTEDRGVPQLVFRLVPTAPELPPQAHDSMCAHWIALADALTGGGARPITVDLPMARPAHADLQRERWGCSVRYGAPHLAVHWRPTDLDSPLITRDPELEDLLVAEAERWLRALDHPLTDRVRDLVSHADPPAKSTLRGVGRKLGMSERTLQRRLTEEQTTFRDTVETALHQLAVRGLTDPTRTIDAVGLNLGYADRRAFHRAFVRWTGLPPAEWRERQLSGQAAKASTSS